uniref:Uncharacterized protein n=1 Tax=Rhizophora mucronata TaxID=61149 RepID=A0A2P2N2X0_RHIMU
MHTQIMQLKSFWVLDECIVKGMRVACFVRTTEQLQYIWVLDLIVIKSCRSIHIYNFARPIVRKCIARVSLGLVVLLLNPDND